VLLLAAGGQGCQRAAMEGPLEGNDPVALGMATRGLVFTRHFDGAFHRLSAGIGEEDGVGEACRAQTVGQPFTLGNAIKVRNVDQLRGLGGDRLDNLWMSMAERVDRDPRGEIEVAVAIGGSQPSALASLKGKVYTRIRWHQMRCHGAARPNAGALRKRNVPPRWAAPLTFY